MSRRNSGYFVSHPVNLKAQQQQNQQFQFTPPRGGRLSGAAWGCRSGCFNSRPRVGGDTVADTLDELGPNLMEAMTCWLLASADAKRAASPRDRKSTRLNSSHSQPSLQQQAASKRLEDKSPSRPSP